MSQCCLNSTWHVHIVSLHVKSMCFTLNYPCPCCYPLSISLPVELSLSPSLFSLPLTRCLLTSCAQMAETSRRDWVVMEGARTQTPPNRHARKQARAEHHRLTCYSRVPGLLSQSLALAVFIFPTSIHCVWPHQYETDASNSHVTADKHGLRPERSGIWLFLSSNWISVILYVWLIGKWLDCGFWPRGWGKFVVETGLVQQPS